MRKALRAITGGVVGTTIMVVALLVMDVETRSKLSLFEAIARFFGVPNQVALGFLVFLFFGVVVWPLVFAAVDPYIPPGEDSAVSAMLFAAALWLAFMVVGTAEMDIILLPLYAIMTLLAHLAYGFTLGLVYGWRGWPSTSEPASIGREFGGEEK